MVSGLRRRDLSVISRWTRRLAATVLLGALVQLATGCRGRPPGTTSARHLVDSLIPLVESAIGIDFSVPPRFEMRSKAQVQQYLRDKLEQEFPESKVRGVTAAYGLLELIPDTIDLKGLLLPLYAEQVVGYYDPDTRTLYAVEGAPEDQLRLVLAHELVHALQHERLPLERLLKDLSNADRLAASQAVLEGHATVAMMGVVMPDRSVVADTDFWRLYRDQVKASQTSMPVFSRAPLILQEGLIFPYLGGAEFIRWWQQQGRPSLPARDSLPQSTEQVIHPDRYLGRDLPVSVAFADSAPRDSVVHEDTMGELELQIWSAEMRGGGEVLTEVPLGWGGDRFRVYQTEGGPALVLVTVWDDSTAARRFAAGPAARFAARTKVGYRTAIDILSLGGRPAVRIVRAPDRWARWNELPAVRVEPAAEPGA
jgi:hypothetical protein